MDTPAPPYELLSDRARDMAGATAVGAPGFITDLGLTGKNQIVALADSGLDSGNLNTLHPDFRNDPGQYPKIVMLKSWVNNEPARDQVGHGTHMAGIIAGNGAASGGKYKGIAPEASLYIQSINDKDGRLLPPSPLGRLFAPSYSAGARIHVNGWGSPKNYYGRTAAEADRFIRSYPDFLVIYGAGNGGPGPGTITAEANSKNALVVGAVQNPRPAFEKNLLSTGTPSELSSRGPTKDGRIKPELLAPGTSIIAPKSSLTEGNFPANPLYTRMQGTSMAAAVTGGSAALLRQYLVAEDAGKTGNPSAALVKALLINGARTGPQGPTKDGFGVLDVTGTIMPLRERSWFYTEEQTGAGEGETKTYRVTVTDEKRPLKITLAWTDPAAQGEAEQTLVNNLDLSVVGPDSKGYKGNQFLGTIPDSTNNVEQIYIPSPVRGTYTIRVYGNRIGQSAVEGASRPAQDYALVCGQSAYDGFITGQANEQIELDNGRRLHLSRSQTVMILDGRRLSEPAANPLTGADLYRVGNNSVLISRRWQASGIQTIEDGDQRLVIETNPKFREGGYFLHPQAQARINGGKADISKIPRGVEVTGMVNPSSQTLWTMDVGYREVNGRLEGIDREKGTLRLLPSHQSFPLSKEIVYTYEDQPDETAGMDIPFPAGQGSDRFLPGLPVRLVLSPTTGEVLHMVTQRKTVTGVLNDVKVLENLISLQGGARYHLVSGGAVYRNEEPSTLRDLHPGDQVVALILPGEDKVVELNAFDKIRWGRIVHVSREQNLIYLVDTLNRLQSYRLTPSVKINRWGVMTDTTVLTNGNWAWVHITDSRDIEEIDVIESENGIKTVFSRYDPGERTLTTRDGFTYKVSSHSLLAKNGVPILPEDLVKDEALTLDFTQQGQQKVLVSALAQTIAGTLEPKLEVTSFYIQDKFYIIGQTSGDALYAYRFKGSSRSFIPIDARGRFTWFFQPEAEEKSVQFVSVNRNTGGIVRRQVTIPSNEQQPFAGNGQRGKEAAIGDMAASGLLQRYPGGTGAFRTQG
ncbi:S8 family serine peptidase [Heliomicrobium undosum]|uniref:S8 family serine peptidase n=1 Tax=Heliomicrobium undosum TaxID=121734 RepID=UPI00136DF0C7|nr:S8 family serine peptidase [Heliomicrobium undosum]